MSVLLLGAGALALGGVLAAGAVIGRRTRPRPPAPGPVPEHLALESPAIVNLLTNGFVLTVDAVPATVLDLAVRRWIRIETCGRGATVCHVRSEPGQGDLRPYERRVLAHLREPPVGEARIAGRGASRWWRAFAEEVVTDARERGLCRSRWRRALVCRLRLGLGAALALGFLGVFLREVPLAQALVLTGGSTAFALMLASWIWSRVGLSKRQTGTPHGYRAASRWLGLRDYLAEHADFGSDPTTAVGLWGRHIAHGTAMGLAPAVARGLPLHPEDIRHGSAAR